MDQTYQAWRSNSHDENEVKFNIEEIKMNLKKDRLKIHHKQLKNIYREHCMYRILSKNCSVNSFE